MARTRTTLLGAARWLAVVVPVADLGLVVSGVLDARTGLIVALVLELALVGVVLVEIRLFGAAYRRGRAGGRTRSGAVVLGMEAAWPPIVVRGVRAELGLLRAVWWGARGRRAVPPGAVELACAERFTVLMWAVGCLGALEVGVVHVLTARWPVLQWSLFALGVYAVVWVLGFGLSLRQHPHLLHDGELVLRFGHFRSIRVPLDRLQAPRARTASGHRRTVVLEDGRLAVSVMGDTNIELRFEPPVQVEVAGHPEQVSRIAFYADDVGSAVRLLRNGPVSAGR